MDAGLSGEDEPHVLNPKKSLFYSSFYLNIFSKHSRNAKNIKTAGKNH